MLVQVQKTLSPNDTGDTRSHQAGIHVPKALRDFFPALNELGLNPRASLQLQSDQGVIGTGSYIHYNNKVVGDGTRDEYRITRIRPFLAECGARAGDTIEFSRVSDNQYVVRVVSSGVNLPTDRVIVNLSNGWRTVRV